EWPPHPDRLFQALAAAWGRNEKPLEDERAALEWLEQLDAQEVRVSAPHAHTRDTARVYVPPNDARTTNDPERSVRVVPELRMNRQPRGFPAVLPAAEPPVVRYIWRQADGSDEHRAALSRLAGEVTYLGHSHTLVRVALVEGDAEGDEWDHAWVGGRPTALRMPHAGRLAHLIDCQQRAVRPNPSLALQSFASPPGAVMPHTLFDPDSVIVLADEGGFVPALDVFPLVAKRFRDALLKTAEQNGQPIPTLLSGHDPDGSPAGSPHMAVVPLADVGWSYSRGRLMGLALLWPRTAAEAEHSAALQVLATFLREGGGELHFGRSGSWRIGLEPASDRASLRVERYARASRRWGTVLPVVLDRYPKNKPGADLAAICVQACLNLGLPEQSVDGLSIEVHAHSPIAGAPSVRAVAEALAKDSPYRGRPMRHMALTFAEPIRGPLVLGAGRYRGLGLCLPLDEDTGP
ncbi:MAG TPA: type I-U CRISPR-associated protein Csb2, partial [Thermoleophilia bacterium]|nr:type I-U CRISPR-associated protein Csb2 [Thermoleophilia bacterium]